MAPVQEDVERIVNRLPATQGECRRVRHLILASHNRDTVTDEALAHVLRSCPSLLSIVLSGIPEVTDRTVVEVASNCHKLQGLDLTGCNQVTDVGVLELTVKSLPLEWIQLNGVGISDPSVCAIAKSCSRLVELELCDLPLLTALPVRDIWSFSRKLRTLRLARCPLLTDKAFPSPPRSDQGGSPKRSDSPQKPLPPTPTDWVQGLPPLILPHSADNLRILDLGQCTKITDEAIAGIVAHAPKIQSLVLSGCVGLTDQALDSIGQLGDNLDTLMFAHVANITDRGIVKLCRSCQKIRSADFSFCRYLTDMAVFELASIPILQRLSLVRVHKLTDNSVLFLAEHAMGLERLHLSYCDNLSLSAVQTLLRKLLKLQLLTATGIPSFKRRGIRRFSDAPPGAYDLDQQAAFRVFSGDNVRALRFFLDKELQRRRDAETRNIKFVPRADDKLDLY